MPKVSPSPLFQNAEVETKIPRSGFKFYGSRKTLLPMLLKFSLLNLITLGIYRFWSKTYLRRYLWSSVELEGDRFEYHGTVKELFLGFLVVIIVLFFLGIMDTGVRMALEVNTQAITIYSAIYSMFFLFLFQYALYRLWRYRLTRTSWRTVRFSMVGKASRYALRAMGWLLLVPATLGLIIPWMQVSLLRLRINESRFGTRVFQCSASGKMVAPQFYGLYMGVILFFLFLISLPSNKVFKSFGTDGGADIHAQISIIILLIAVVTIVFAMFFAITLYRIFVYKVILDNTTLGNIKVRVSYPYRRLLAPFLATLGVYGLMFGFMFGMAIGFRGFWAEASPWLIGGVVFVLVVLMQVIHVLIFGFAVLKLLCEGITLENTDNLQNIVQDAQSESSYGEGLADALDVGAF